MGKKINPKVIRLGITRSWQSKWFGFGKTYINKAKQDVQIRKFLIKELKEAGIDRVEIERGANKINIGIYTAKPGLIIGRGGTGVDDMKKKIHQNFLSNPSGIKPGDVNLNIYEVDRPNLSAQIAVQLMIIDIEKRIPFKRVMKQAIGRIERAGTIGVKVRMGGRLNGAEIARAETLTTGKIPLQTLRADIDYARGVAHTTYGTIGVKAWIYKGDKFKQEEVNKGEVLGVNTK